MTELLMAFAIHSASIHPGSDQGAPQEPSTLSSQVSGAAERAGEANELYLPYN